MDGMRQSVEQKLGGYESRMDKIGAILDDKLSQNDRRIEEMRATMERKMDALQKENNQKLEEMRLTVDEKLHATLDKRLGESFQLSASGWSRSIRAWARCSRWPAAWRFKRF